MELNRQERRALKKSQNTKGKRSSLSKLYGETVDVKAKALLENVENLFVLEDYNIDIIPLAVYMFTELASKEIVEHVDNRFYSIVNISEIAGIDIESQEDLDDNSMYLASLSRDRDLYLRNLKTCRLSKNQAMQFMITTIFKLSADLLFGMIREESIKNNASVISGDTVFRFKEAPIEYRLKIVCAFISVYWGIKNKLVDDVVLARDLEINTDGSLVEFIAPLIPSGEEYVKWIKQKCSLSEAILNSGDSKEIEPELKSEMKAKYKMMKSMIVERFLFSSRVVKAINDAETFEEKINEQKDKVKAIRKERNDVQKELKLKIKELSDTVEKVDKLETELSSKQEFISTLENNIKDLENNSKEAGETLRVDLKEAEGKIKYLDERLKSYEEIMDVLNSKIDRLEYDKNSQQRTIEILTKKLNIANNKLK